MVELDLRSLLNISMFINLLCFPFNIFIVFSLTKILGSLSSYTLSAHEHRSCLFTRDLLFGYCLGEGTQIWDR